jgi:hypothetical protein
VRTRAGTAHDLRRYGGPGRGKPVRLHIAPGLTLEDGPLNQVRHHAILGHGLAVQAIRAMGRAGTKVGPAKNMPHALPAIDAPEHVKAAEAATRALNIHYLGPMLEGRYDDAYLKRAGRDAPRFTDEDFRAIGSPLDFVGINVYIPSLLVVASDQPPGYREVPFNVSHPKMFSAWHRLAPESQYWSPRLLHSIWKPKEIYVTENGCAASDAVAAGDGAFSTCSTRPEPRSAKSSTPSTRGTIRTGSGMPARTRRAVCRETVTARTDSTRAPARPANSRTTAPTCALRRGVRRW